MSQAAALRIVRLTARTSAMLFAGAQAASLAGRRGARASETLYQAFMVAHVVHFAAVTRYAVLTGGHDLFPGGRDLRRRRRLAHRRRHLHRLRRRGHHRLGRPADHDPGEPGGPAPPAWLPGRVIGTMFTGTFAGQLSRSAWYAVPTVISGTATVLGTVGPRRWLP